MLRFSKEISLTDICNFLIIKICKKWNLHNIRRFFQLDHCNSILRFFQPMHKQPVYADAPVYTNGVEEELFKIGMCLPAGPYVTDDDVRYIVECIKEAIVK